jgi:DNA-binding MarR family transcriptional regulator
MSKDSLILKTCEVELLGLGITMASRSIANFFNKYLKKYNVTMNQVYILYAVAEYRGNNLDYMAHKMFINHKSMMVTMKSMPDYVEMHKSRHDKRSIYPALTEKGANFLKKVMPALIDLEEGIGLLAKGKSEFIEFVYRFSGAITKKSRKFK